MLLNPFVPSASFLYPLKTSENLRVFWCFQGGRKRVHWERKGLKKLCIDDSLIYIFSDWLCGLTLRLKNQNLNLFEQTSSVQSFDWLVNFISSGMCNLFIGFFIFIIAVCNYLCRLFRKFWNNLFNRKWSRLVVSK